MPTPILKIFPYTKWPTITNHITIFYVPLVAFASPIYVLTIDTKWIFDPKTAYLLGIGHQGYKCFDVSTWKFFISHHVVFDESLYSYTVPKSVAFTLKFSHIILPPNPQLSPFSSFISVSTIIQRDAPSHLHMTSTPSPSTDFHVDFGSPVRNGNQS